MTWQETPEAAAPGPDGQRVQAHVLSCVLGQLRAESLRGCKSRCPCAYEVRCRLRAVCSAAQTVRDGGRPLPVAGQGAGLQIIGRPSDVERLLDEAGQRAQEVECGAAQRVWAEPSGTWGAWQKGPLPWRPPRARLLERWLAWRELVRRQRRGIAGGAAYGLARGTGWVLENTLFRPQQGSEDAAVQDVRSANGMNDATQPQHFSLRTGSSTSGSPASSRASSQSGFRVQAQSNTPRPFSWGLNPVALPQSQSSRASSSSGQSRRSLPPPSFDQLARDIEAA